MVRSVDAFHAEITSGLRGSPALTQCRSRGILHFEMSWRTISRSAVGGAHQVVMGKLASVSRTRLASNFPRASTAKTQAPMCHGPKKLDQAALAQPVSERF